MKSSLIIIVFAWVLPNVFGGMFWNGNPQLLRARARTRPVRHYSPSTHRQHVNNRIYKPPPPIMRHREPTQYPPIVQTYRPASPGGPMLLNTPPAYIGVPPQHVPPQNFRQPMPGQSRPLGHKQRPPELAEFSSPVSSPNFIESSGVKIDSGMNQHGYLSPTYSGWKPIPKPFVGHQTSPAETVTTFVQTTEPYIRITTRKQNSIIPTTIYRENVQHLKPMMSGVKLQPEYSENQGVTVPRPIHDPPSSTYRLPPTFLAERPTSNTLTIAEIPSTEKGLGHKGFPKFQSRSKPNTNSKPETVGIESPQLLSKFKISRPKLKQVKAHPSFQTNEPEIEGLGQGTPPKVTFSANHGANSVEHGAHAQSNVNNQKIHKTRSRVKVKARRPEGFVNADQLSHVLAYRSPGQTPGPGTVGKGSSESSAQSHHRHPSPSYLGNETYDHSPFRSPPAYATPFPFPSDFMNGFGSDELQPSLPPNHVPPSPMVVPGQKVEKQVYGGGSKQNGFQSHMVGDLGPKQGQGGRRKRPKHHSQQPTTTEGQPQPSVPFNNDQGPIYPEDFYMPPGFTQNPSLRGHNPVSFMTMPNSKPQVIHHSPYQHYSHAHQHLPTISIPRAPPADPYSNPQEQHSNDGNRPQYSSVGTTQNNAYQVHGNQNQPHVFLNIRNGQNEISGPGHRPYRPLYDGSTSFDSFPQRPHLHEQELPEFQAPLGAVSPLQMNSVNPYSIGGERPQNLPKFPIPSPPPENKNYQQPTSQGHPNFRAQNPSVNLEAFASNEYERIPMEFMNDLRPILLEESQPSSTSSSRRPVSEKVHENARLNQQQISFDTSAGLQEQNSPDTTLKNSFQLQTNTETATKAYTQTKPGPGSMEHHIPFESSEATQSAGGGFMDEFFRSQAARPFIPSSVASEGSSGSSTKLYLDPLYAESSTEREGFDNYKSGSSLEPQMVKQDLDGPAVTKSTVQPPKFIDHTPLISTSPIHEYSLVATVSPIQDVDLPNPASQEATGPKWSKLRKDGESRGGGGVSFTDLYKNPLTNKYKKLDKEHDAGTQLVPEIKGISSTLRSSSTKTLDDDAFPKGPYSQPTPLVLKNMTLDDLLEDDSSDSNTPSSRVLSENRVQPHFRRSTSNPTTTTIKPDLTTTMTGTTMSVPIKRRFTRRRQPLLANRKVAGRSKVNEGEVLEEYDVPVTTHHPRNYFDQSKTERDAEEEKAEMGFESSRISLKSSRGRMGEKSPEVGSRMEVTGGKRATTPGSVNPNGVTYGESQWFQVKEEGRGGKSLELNYYPDHLEEKEERGKISFSSRILSKTPHVKLESLDFDSVATPTNVKDSRRNLSPKHFHSTDTEKKWRSRRQRTTTDSTLLPLDSQTLRN